jgi:hypothetical protein
MGFFCCSEASYIMRPRFCLYSYIPAGRSCEASCGPAPNAPSYSYLIILFLLVLSHQLSLNRSICLLPYPYSLRVARIYPPTVPLGDPRPLYTISPFFLKYCEVLCSLTRADPRYPARASTRVHTTLSLRLRWTAGLPNALATSCGSSPHGRSGREGAGGEREMGGGGKGGERGRRCCLMLCLVLAFAATLAKYVPCAAMFRFCAAFLVSF